VFVLGSVFPFGMVGNLLGLFVAAFLYGTVAGDSHYLSIGLASGAAGGIASVLGNLTLTLLGPGIPIAAVGVVGGLFAGVLGHYFGRDLRDGLTRDV
jgi:membrane associated rhomboid family serine protease